MTEEGRIKREICDYLALFPKRCMFTMTPRGFGGMAYTSRYMQKGWPDLTGFWDERPLFIEVKTPQGRLSKEQKEFFEKASQFPGVIFIVARDVSDVMNVLK